MPKIIDHESYRIKLAKKAAHLFSTYGYSGLGMRQIADQLGISKSALYHYFPSKKELFLASTKIVINDQKLIETNLDLLKKTIDEKLDIYMSFVQSLEKDFPNEISLLIDYLRNMKIEEIKHDASIKFSTHQFLEITKSFVGDNNALPVLCMMQGLLLQRYFDGYQTDYLTIKTWLSDILKTN